jgi:hypothetical protein
MIKIINFSKIEVQKMSSQFAYKHPHKKLKYLDYKLKLLFAKTH